VDSENKSDSGSGTVPKSLKKNLKKAETTTSVDLLQKTALL